MLCELIDITKTYPVPSGLQSITVLDSVSLQIDLGESVAITGPSGSGKTTLLNIAAAMDLPDHGKVIIDGEEISVLKEDKLSCLRNRKIGIVFQRHYLLPQCTLLENVLVPTLPYRSKVHEPLLYKRAKYLLERMGLLNRIDHFPSQLSGGECQRVALARALINSPSLLCADEPTGSLDRRTAGEMATLLKQINREEKTALLVVTHSEELALQMDRQFEISNGKLKQQV